MQGSQPCNTGMQQDNYLRQGSANAALRLRKLVISAHGLEVRVLGEGAVDMLYG